MSRGLMEIAERGKLAPEVELDAFWDAFCDRDPTPDDFIDRMEAAGLVEIDSVNNDDLDDPFAEERGIVSGGLMWRLTAKGCKALKDAMMEARK